MIIIIQATFWQEQCSYWMNYAFNSSTKLFKWDVQSCRVMFNQGYNMDEGGRFYCLPFPLLKPAWRSLRHWKSTSVPQSLQLCLTNTHSIAHPESFDIKFKLVSIHQPATALTAAQYPGRKSHCHFTLKAKQRQTSVCSSTECSRLCPKATQDIIMRTHRKGHCVYKRQFPPSNPFVFPC